MGYLFVAFIIMPILELAVIIQVGQGIGVLPTVALLFVVSIVGAWMVKASGLSVLNRIRRQLMMGQLPTDELVDGVIIAVAGALMLTPGFITDAVGLSLLFAPVRAVVRRSLAKRFRRTVVSGTTFDATGSPFGESGFGDTGFGTRDVIDIDPGADNDPGPRG